MSVRAEVDGVGIRSGRWPQCASFRRLPAEVLGAGSTRVVLLEGELGSVDVEVLGAVAVDLLQGHRVQAVGAHPYTSSPPPRHTP